MKRSTFVILFTALVCGLVFTLGMLYVEAARVEPTEYTQTEYGMERFVLYGTNYGEFYVLVIKSDTSRVDELQLGIYGSCYLSGISHRIREALGVSDD